MGSSDERRSENVELPVPLCGDPTCESEGCTQASIDRWIERQAAEARAIVYGYLLLPPIEHDAASGRRPDDGD